MMFAKVCYFFGLGLDANLWLVYNDENTLESPIVDENGESGIANGARKSGVDP